jgi:hypothetical protein
VAEVTNSDLFNVLLEIKGDVGGLKATTELQLQALTLHAARIGKVEDTVAKGKGAAKVWAIVGAGAASVFGAGAAAAIEWFKH